MPGLLYVFFEKSLGEVNAWNSPGDAGDDVARDGFCSCGEFFPRDVRPHNFCHISRLHAAHVSYIHHDLIHGDATQYGAVRAVKVYAGSGVGKVVQVAIPKADADGGHFGGAVGNIGVVIGYSVVAG